MAIKASQARPITTKQDEEAKPQAQAQPIVTAADLAAVHAQQPVRIAGPAAAPEKAKRKPGPKPLGLQASNVALPPSVWQRLDRHLDAQVEKGDPISRNAAISKAVTAWLDAQGAD